jgi:Lrp/AsnC family transcriptional regulator, regulator for asnA, asnC and gidA
VLTAGRYDVICEVICADDDALLEILNRTIRTMPGVHQAETLVYLKTVKQQYNWANR